MRSLSSFKASFDARPVTLRLILTSFQLACQRIYFYLYTHNSLHQTFGEVSWRIIYGPRSTHAGLILLCQPMKMVLQPA